MRLEHKVLIFLVILTQKSDDRDLLICEKFNFFSLNERALRRHDCQLWKLARRNGPLLLSWWWTNKKQMNLLWWRHLDRSIARFSVKVFLELFGGNRLETCDPQLYISLHCLCYDESRAISDQAYVSLYLLSSQKKWEIVLPWKKKSFGPTHPTASVTWTSSETGLQGKLTHFTLVHSHETTDKLGQIKIY